MDTPSSLYPSYNHQLVIHHLSWPQLPTEETGWASSCHLMQVIRAVHNLQISMSSGRGSGLNVRNPKKCWWFLHILLFFQKITWPEKPGKNREMAGKNREISWFRNPLNFSWNLVVSEGSWLHLMICSPDPLGPLRAPNWNDHRQVRKMILWEPFCGKKHL